jgi:hypothetical protein
MNTSRGELDSTRNWLSLLYIQVDRVYYLQYISGRSYPKAILLIETPQIYAYISLVMLSSTESQIAISVRVRAQMNTFAHHKK